MFLSFTSEVYKTTYLLTVGNKTKLQFQTSPQTPERPRKFFLPFSPPTPGTPDTPQTPQSLPRNQSKPIKDQSPLPPSQPHFETDHILGTKTGTNQDDTNIYVQVGSLEENQKKRIRSSNLARTTPKKEKNDKKDNHEVAWDENYPFNLDTGIHCDTVHDYKLGPRVHSDAVGMVVRNATKPAKLMKSHKCTGSAIHHEDTPGMEEDDDSDENQIIMPN
jgi:hypothetical protein